MPELSKYLSLFLSESTERLEAMQKSLMTLEHDPTSREQIDQYFRDAHSLKGMAAAMGFNGIRDLAHACEDIMHAVRDDNLTFDTGLADRLLDATAWLQKLVGRIAEGEEPGRPPAELVHSLHEVLQGLPERNTGGVSIPELPDVPDIPDIPDVEPKKAAPQAPSLPPERAPRAAPASRSDGAQGQVKIPTELLDRLIDGLGEIMAVREVLRSEVSTARNPLLIEALVRLDRAAAELRDDVVASRMSPLSVVLDRLPIVARNVARARGKEIETKITGAEIDIDRSILGGLDQPLMHVIRNCADHGIETSEERVQAGKSAKGTIEIAVRREKDLVIIEVHDDGRGMDSDVIVAKAVEAGVVSAKKAETLDERQKLELVFIPGFTTREEVTDVSGRGVGMDAARSAIERFGGTVSVDSTRGQGTTITLSLPRLLSLMDVIMVVAGGERFAIPLSKVERTVEVPSEHVIEDDGVLRMRLGDDAIPYRPMAEIIRTGVEAAPHGIARALVVAAPGGPYAIGVDEISGMREVVVKPLALPLAQIEGLTGVALIDGVSPVFVVEPQKLL